jgi:hypothetical protein
MFGSCVQGGGEDLRGFRWICSDSIVFHIGEEEFHIKKRLLGRKGGFLSYGDELMKRR